MNDIARAMKVAGVKLPPQNRRIWQLLKDNGPQTVKAISSTIHISEPVVQAQITNMMLRGMLKKIANRSHTGLRLNNTYEAQGRSFELLPMPLTNGKTLHVVPPVEATAAPTTPEFSPEKLLANCTLSQMHQTYNFLKRWFK